MFKNIMLVLAFIGLGVLGFFTYKFNGDFKASQAQNQLLETQKAELQARIDAWEETYESQDKLVDFVDVYVLNKDVDPGREFLEEDLEIVQIPKTILTENAIQDLEPYFGKVWKVAMDKGSVAVGSLMMNKELYETVYEQDMTFRHLPLGLKVGDYVDVRIVLPHGETFYIMTHKRVEQLVHETHTVKLYLTEAESILWESAKKDRTLFEDYGLSVHIVKYVEPGLQDTTMSYYPVRLEMEPSVYTNPNITNKGLCINTKLREQIDIMLANVLPTEKDILAQGVKEDDRDINDASNLADVEPDNELSGDASVVDPSTDVGGIEYNDGNANIDNTEPEDVPGQGVIVTDKDKVDAEGDNLYHDEEEIK